VLLSIEQVSERFGVPKATLYSWRHRGVGPPSFRVEGAVRYDEADIERYVEAQKAASAR
jgi:predicted DNA-binding transcriptional regulator AlpA